MLGLIIKYLWENKDLFQMVIVYLLNSYSTAFPSLCTRKKLLGDARCLPVIMRECRLQIKKKEKEYELPTSITTSYCPYDYTGQRSPIIPIPTGSVKVKDNYINIIGRTDNQPIKSLESVHDGYFDIINNDTIVFIKGNVPRYVIGMNIPGAKKSKGGKGEEKQSVSSVIYKGNFHSFFTVSNIPIAITTGCKIHYNNNILDINQHQITPHPVQFDRLSSSKCISVSSDIFMLEVDKPAAARKVLRSGSFNTYIHLIRISKNSNNQLHLSINHKTRYDFRVLSSTRLSLPSLQDGRFYALMSESSTGHTNLHLLGVWRGRAYGIVHTVDMNALSPSTPIPRIRTQVDCLLSLPIYPSKILIMHVSLAFLGVGKRWGVGGWELEGSLTKG